MELKTFFENFEIMAEAPGGVPKLREMVLQLAVQGKLVPQDPNDEPASVLIQKVQAEKERLIREKVLRRPKPLSPVGEDEVQFDCPIGWEWCRLGAVAINIHYGYTASADNTIRDVRLLRITDIQNSYVNWEAVPGCKIKRETFYQYELKSGDLLIARTGGTIGKTYLVEKIPVSAVFASYLIRLIPSGNIFPRYIKHFTASSIYWRQLYAKTSGTGQPNVNATALKSMGIPLPPENEQKRIVAKVDELMALCDDLETRKQKTQQTCIRINESCIDKMLAAREASKFNKHWRRIHTNFDLLYSQPANVSKLRQAILQLAVKGKLVPQDPNDEPASLLLQRIRAEKERLIKAGGIKKSKPLPPIDIQDMPYDIPNGWCWVRLGNLCELITKGSSPKWQGVNYVDSGEGILFITSENVGNYFLRTEKRKYVEKRFNEIEPRSILNRNDILMNIVGASIGRTAIYDLQEVANINQAVCLVRLFMREKFLDLKYFLYFFNSPMCIGYMFDKQVDNARANLSMSNVARFAVPLPPTNEQVAISEKVSQLMALCDDLEANLLKSQSENDKLMEYAVAELLAA